MKGDRYEEIIRIGKRRGFLWPSYEIYGGAKGFISFGSLGSALKHNIENLWRRTFLRRLGVLEIETPLISPAKVFEASGHVKHFKDPMVECESCKRRFKADLLVKEQTDLVPEQMSLNEMGDVIRRRVKCPQCGGRLSKPRYFITMFQTRIGPYSDARGFGRPEAAQAMFIAFKRYYEHARKVLPFGVGQVGRVLRNEISPRQGPIRLREFTIMELELFFNPKRPGCNRLGEVKDDVLRILTQDMQVKGKSEEVTVVEGLKRGYVKTEWQAYFMALAQRFMLSLNVPRERQRFREHLPDEKAHYSLQTYDQEILLDRWGWIEVSGHSYRGDYDLSRHTEFSGVDMSVVDEEGRKFVPHVVEPSFGSERITYCALEYAYSRKGNRTIMRFPREIAPVSVAVLPLVNKDDLPSKAHEVYDMLFDEGFSVSYDDRGSIGRRYARTDEAGTPIAITIDYDTMRDDSVTLRDRDTWRQVRVKVKELPGTLRAYFTKRADIFQTKK